MKYKLDIWNKILSVACVYEENAFFNWTKAGWCDDFSLTLCCDDENNISFNELEAGCMQGIIL